MRRKLTRTLGMTAITGALVALPLGFGAGTAAANDWDAVAACESGGNWGTNTGNGYYGGLQFSLDTWRAYGGRGRPDQQPAWYQSGIAERVKNQSGLHHWPHCGQYYRG